MHARLTLFAAALVAMVLGPVTAALAQAPAPPPEKPVAPGSPAPATSILAAPAAAAQDESFAIKSFAVIGNTILPQDDVTRLVAPFTGEKRVYGDVQKALEALEGAYRSRGFSAVQVFVPEQTLDSGTVKLTVIEAKVANVKLEGHAFFSDANIIAALPSLAKGKTPNARDIAANVRVANENPARQVDVVLGVGEAEDEVNATVTVSDTNPRKFISSVDNTGNNSTGQHRLSLGFQHANLFDADHVMTAQYTTSVEKPSQVSIYSVSYRVPLYRFDGSIDAILVKSSVDSGSTATTEGLYRVTGKGNVLGLRFNQYLPRQGEFTHQITYSFDYKATETPCVGSLCAGLDSLRRLKPVTSHPIGILYSGGWAGVGRQTGFSISALANWAWGQYGGVADFHAARQATIAGISQGGASPNFSAYKAMFSHARVLPADLQFRGSVTAQWTPQALIPSEQFGLAGSSGVRGFQEREFLRDRGYTGNVELYGPDWGDKLLAGSNLRMVVFYDLARGYNFRLPGEDDQRLAIASVGLGVRFNLGKNLSLRADYARVTDVRVMNATSSQVKGDARGHFALSLSF